VARLFEPAAIDFDGFARVADAWAIVEFVAQVARVGLCGGAGGSRELFVALTSVCFSSARFSSGCF
jgi:hypothetical protein